MLQDADAERIESLKLRLRAKTKIQIVRQALDALERDADRADRVLRWRRAVRRVRGESLAVLREFQPYSRLRRIDG